MDSGCGGTTASPRTGRNSFTGQHQRERDGGIDGVVVASPRSRGSHRLRIVRAAERINRPHDVLRTMDDFVPRIATALAALFALGAFVTLFMQRPVVAGTLFVFTAFSIYIRETNK